MKIALMKELYCKSYFSFGVKSSLLKAIPQCLQFHLFSCTTEHIESIKNIELKLGVGINGSNPATEDKTTIVDLRF